MKKNRVKIHTKISKTVDILDLAGKLKVKKNIGQSALKAREYMENNYKREKYD